MKSFLKFFVSLGGIGYIKPLSATHGSFVAGIILFFLFPDLNIEIKIISCLAILILGTIAGEYILRKDNFSPPDPHYIVIDEALGMMITIFLCEKIWWQFLLAFILFRIFDIIKIWPASTFDKMHGGLFVMLDDVFAGFYALLTLQIIIYLI